MSHGLPAPVLADVLMSILAPLFSAQRHAQGILLNKSDIISLLKTLQWLPCSIGIKVKGPSQTYKTLHDLAPLLSLNLISYYTLPLLYSAAAALTPLLSLK